MKKIVILTPIYNDWKSLLKLIEKIDFEISKWNFYVSIYIVNDASTEKRPTIDKILKNIKSIKVINMKNNLGHARCYATGLKFLIEKENFDYVILMDGDGEDQPNEISLFFQKIKENPTSVVTANRVKRSEGPLFKLLYEFHKILTYIFTGKLIKFGNYGCLPRESAIKLVKEASIWSSYSGTLAKTIPNRDSVPSFRGIRYFGPSQMNFFNLLIHSFSIIAVFRISVMFRSVLFIFFYLFFVFHNLTFITLFPILAVLVFLFTILKVSSRADIDQLNNSLNNIHSIDNLRNFDSR